MALLPQQPDPTVSRQIIPGHEMGWGTATQRKREKRKWNEGGGYRVCERERERKKRERDCVGRKEIRKVKDIKVRNNEEMSLRRKLMVKRTKERHIEQLTNTGKQITKKERKKERKKQ